MYYKQGKIKFIDKEKKRITKRSERREPKTSRHDKRRRKKFNEKEVKTRFKNLM